MRSSHQSVPVLFACPSRTIAESPYSMILVPTVVSSSNLLDMTRSGPEVARYHSLAATACPHASLELTQFAFSPYRPN